MKEMTLNSLATFKCYGYETVRTRYGLKLLLNVYIEFMKKNYHISHLLSNDEEIVEFFKAIGVDEWNLGKIPSSNGKCIVEKNDNLWIITKWLEKER